MSKREVKIATVEMAISALIAVEVEDTNERKERESAWLAKSLNGHFWSKFKSDLSITLYS